MVCDDHGGSGCGVLGEVAVESNELLCAARRCVVAGLGRPAWTQG